MTVPLIHAAEIALGRQRSPEQEQGDYLVRYLRSANVADGSLVLDDVKTMNFTPREQSTFRLRLGDVLVTEGSGSRDTVGTSAVWRGELPDPVCFQNTLLRLRPRTGIADGPYLAWWARHAHAAGLMANAASGANILHLGAENVRRLPFPALGMDEQRRIADFLDEQVARIDDIIAARRRQIPNLANLLVAIRLSLATGAGAEVCIPSNVDWVPEIPLDWCRSPLKQFYSVSKGKNAQRLSQEFVQANAGQYPVYSGQTADGTFFGRINSFDFNLTEEGILISTVGAKAMTARSVVGKFSLSQNCCLLVPRKNMEISGMSPRFLFHQVTVALSLKRAEIPDHMQPSLRIEDLRGYWLVHPPLPQQVNIAAQIDEAADSLARLRAGMAQEVALLAELKRSLITAAVTGEFDVSSSDGSRVPV